MKMSDTIASIADALAKAQGQIEDATKDGVNPHFKSAYATLAAVRSVIREPLATNGLSYIQPVRLDGNAVEVETMLMHSSGEFISEVLRMPVNKMDAHGIGSATSYARRYSLMSILGLAADDDDGNAAVASTPVEQKRQPVTPRAVPQLDQEESKQAREQIIKSMDECDTPADYDRWADENRSKIGALRVNDQELVRSAFKAQRHATMKALEEAAKQ